LNEFTIDDLRLMIGQKISLNHLMPLAIERLQSDPLAEGDYYPGDLLCTVLSVSPAHWDDNNVQRNEVEMIATQALQRFQFDDEISDVERKALENAMCVFQLSSGKDR
jgi:CDI immunity proteins